MGGGDERSDAGGEYLFNEDSWMEIYVLTVPLTIPSHFRTNHDSVECK
jgi:hypothetical protein